MSENGITNILLEAGTNELEIVEFHLDEAVTPLPGEDIEPGTIYRGYYGVNVAKVTEIIRMPRVTELPESQDPSVLGAFNLRDRFMTDYPTVQAYIVYDEPNFKVKVGDFRTRLEAYLFLQRIRADYPGTIIRDNIYPMQIDWTEMVPESEDDI